jgi:3-deoxy-D-manno-octulosonic-acid transferase
MSILLSTYLAASHITGPAFAALQRRAIRKGKEDPTRRGERWGQAGEARPVGSLVWFHAASVGETQSILPLVQSLLAARPDLHVLITSTTRTSAQMLAADLPVRVIHQMSPYDTAAASRAFLDHWRPDIAIWIESELWPRMLAEVGKRGIPRLLLNARVSERTAKRWAQFHSTAIGILKQFDVIQVQEQTTMRAFEAVGLRGDHVTLTGSLKQDRPALTCDASILADLQSEMDGRDIWCAASTHPGEDAVILEAQRQTDRLLILVPRHIERAEKILEICKAKNLRVAQRSQSDPLQQDTQVYLADTMGELGLWYRLAPVAFIGGSLAPVGGHNPYEAAQLDAAILHGPHVGNFAQIYADLGQVGAARLVVNANDLAGALGAFDAAKLAEMTKAAQTVMQKGAGATDAARGAILARIKA